MTTFAEMYDLVQNIVRRPEAQGVVDPAIRTATLRAHHVDFFRRDLKVVDHGYTVINDAHFHDFENISDSLLPRLRLLKILLRVSPDGRYPLEQLEYRESDDLYDADGMPRRIIYTVIGETLRCYFRSSQPAGCMFITGLIQSYSLPDIAAGLQTTILRSWRIGRQQLCFTVLASWTWRKSCSAITSIHSKRC